MYFCEFSDWTHLPISDLHRIIAFDCFSVCIYGLIVQWLLVPHPYCCFGVRIEFFVPFSLGCAVWQGRIIDYLVFLFYFEKLQVQNLETALNYHFTYLCLIRMFDLNNDGFLSWEEFRDLTKDMEHNQAQRIFRLKNKERFRTL